MKAKPAMSRFQIHDDLTAPEGSAAILRGAMATGVQLPNFLGALAGSPAALRGYVRLRSELRRGNLPAETLERIALAVAQAHRSDPQLAMHARTARAAGLGADEVAAARRGTSADAKQAALLAFLMPMITQRGKPAAYLKEEAIEIGWTDEQLLEAVAVVTMETFAAFVNLAGDIPVDGSIEVTRTLRAA